MSGRSGVRGSPTRAEFAARAAAFEQEIRARTAAFLTRYHELYHAERQAQHDAMWRWMRLPWWRRIFARVPEAEMVTVVNTLDAAEVAEAPAEPVEEVEQAEPARPAAPAPGAAMVTVVNKPAVARCEHCGAEGVEWSRSVVYRDGQPPDGVAPCPAVRGWHLPVAAVGDNAGGGGG